jgi:hypothetical protein
MRGEGVGLCAGGVCHDLVACMLLVKKTCNWVATQLTDMHQVPLVACTALIQWRVPASLLLQAPAGWAAGPTAGTPERALLCCQWHDGAVHCCLPGQCGVTGCCPEPLLAAAGQPHGLGGQLLHPTGRLRAEEQ